MVVFALTMLYTYWFEVRYEYIAVLVGELIAFAFLSRTNTRSSMATGEFGMLAMGAVSMIALTMLALPTLVVGMRYWGIQMRYTYEPSAFGAIVTACSLAIVLNGQKKFAAFSVAYSILCLYLYLWANKPWVEAYDTVRGFSSKLQSLEGAGIRRVYLLAVPVYPFANGLNKLPKYLGLKIEVATAYIDFGHGDSEPHVIAKEGDRIMVKGDYTHLGAVISPHFLFKQEGNGADRMFEFSERPNSVRLLGYDPRKDLVGVCYNGGQIEWVSGIDP